MALKKQPFQPTTTTACFCGLYHSKREEIHYLKKIMFCGV